MKHLQRVLAVLTAAGLALVIAGTASAGTPGSITSISPTSGPTAGGTTVTITGSGFWGAFGPAVTIGGVDAPIVSYSSVGGGQQVVVTTPARAAGAANVAVFEEAGYQRIPRATVPGGFTYVAPTPTPTGPTITVTGVSPASGLTTGGEAITITGTGFSGGSAPTVALGGTAATGVAVVNDTTITATTPARAAGTVDVSVSRDGGTGTKAGAYRYDQGYWLTITNSQPPGTGGSSEKKSTGAVRTSAFGTWGSSKTSTLPVSGSKQTAYTAYAGGINCGNRLERTSIFGSLAIFSTETTWAGGPCKYAFPAGTTVAISALPSSSTSLVPLSIDDYWVGLFNKWTGSCTGTTSECSVTMSADRTARTAWGRFSWGLIGGTATATPVFADDGSLSYSVLTVGFVSTGNAVLGMPQFTMQTTFVTGASATAREAAARGVTACRGSARLVGRRLEARCTPTPALAAALRKGTVRVTTRWYLRAPGQKATYPLGQARAYLSNRRAGAVTG